MKPIRKIALAAWGGVVVSALLFIGWNFVLEPRLIPTVADTFGQGDYDLVMTDGGRFTQATLRGAPSAVFFGFTHCPEVCPTTLGDIAGWQDTLAADGHPPLRTYFVTVDPERDTPALLDDYAGWVPGVTGVTGTPDEIEEAIRAFRVYARKVPLDGGGYTMDHSAMVLLFDDKGRLFEPIGYQEDTERAIAKIRRLLAG
ncbi:electron transporter SenC [Loktanella sp. 3ANDIMAR09]|uniref:SCO family protein n=1 Tax=Loktanella sp. 3ANDIMAR09 TaxID=1225657 RepID=UPI0007005463|nr:SCO family protein [Loktanella sp. 3ANDIMAR09]KQI67454.1 electron transporter SenC [Loktanella sp. 3ANDIMAR09]